MHGNMSNEATLNVSIRSILLILSTVFAVSSATAGPVRGLLPKSSEFRRDGLAFGVGLASTAAFSFGDLVDVNGFGGGPSLRIGTTGGERLVWWLQLDGAAYLFDTQGDGVGRNEWGCLSLAGQRYLLDAFWLKLGAGFASFGQGVRRQVKIEPPERMAGAAVFGGVGLDVFQRGRIAISLELSTSATVLADGGIVQLHGGVAFHIY